MCHLSFCVKLKYLIISQEAAWPEGEPAWIRAYADRMCDLSASGRLQAVGDDLDLSPFDDGRPVEAVLLRSLQRCLAVHLSTNVTGARIKVNGRLVLEAVQRAPVRQQGRGRGGRRRGGH